MKRSGLFAPRTLLTICLVWLVSVIILAVTPPVIRGGAGREGGHDLIREDEVLFDFTVAGATNQWFADDFEDGVIDPTVWQVGGDGVSESGGVLTIFRDADDDSLTTVSTYEKDLEIVVDIRITQMEWHDTFHGISFKDDSNHGISFGFVQYGTFFLAQHEGASTGFAYYSPYTMNQWYRWRLVKSGGTMDIYVDDVWICSGSVPDGSRISFPGYYDDGGSGSGSSSERDNFSVSAGHRVYLPVVMQNAP
jgi:hypothetical protein